MPSVFAIAPCLVGLFYSDGHISLGLFQISVCSVELVLVSMISGVEKSAFPRSALRSVSTRTDFASG